MRYTYIEVIILINRLLEIPPETTASIIHRFGLEGLKNKSAIIGLNTAKHGTKVKDMNISITKARVVAYENSKNRIECLVSDGTTTMPAFIDVGVGAPKLISHAKNDGALKVEAEIQKIPWDNTLVMVVRRYSIMEKSSNQLLAPRTKPLIDIIIGLIYMTDQLEEPYKSITQALMKHNLSALSDCPASKDIYNYRGGLIDNLLRTVQLVDYLQKVNNSSFLSNTISMINKCVVTSYTDLNSYHNGDTSLNLVGLPEIIHRLVKEIVEDGRKPQLSLLKSAIICANLGKIKDIENYQLHSCQMIQKALITIGFETTTSEYTDCISGASIEGKLLTIYTILDEFMYKREGNMI
jgi:hypothetical protein